MKRIKEAIHHDGKAYNAGDAVEEPTTIPSSFLEEYGEPEPEKPPRKRRAE